MFVILLEFSANKAHAAPLMGGHDEWLRDGFEKGFFLVAGTIQPGQGGAVIAHNATREQMKEIVGKDPFVAEDVVTAEIIEITPSRTATPLHFLLAH
jgi:uncharacterized protein YciI